MSLLSGVLGAVGGFITGGPAGAILGGISGYQGGPGGSPGTSIAIRPPNLPAIGAGGGYNIGIGGPGGINFGGNFGLNVGAGAGGAPVGGACPKGWHLNKHPLAASKKHGAVPARSICVRNRSMNPLNPRALRKALSREKRARKLLSRLHIFKAVRHTPPTRRKR